MGDSTLSRSFYFYDMLRRMPSPSTRLRTSRTLLVFLLSLLSACSPVSPSTPFIPPTAPAPLIEPSLIIQPTQPSGPQPTPLPTIAIPTATTSPEECVNNLTFISDLTVFDGTSIPYGTTIDKQWLVQNSGTCNWNAGYRLRYVGGATLGASEELALYPAKSSTQAVIQITFTAPFSDGEYESAWQAFDPSGLAFGDAIYMRIEVVQP
jgi:Ig-like domain from next to BRCA1 gene